MSAEIIQTLLEMTLAMSAGILIVGLFRKPARHLAGARAAYWLWLLVPACVLAVAVPAPEASSALLMNYVPQVMGMPSTFGAAIAGSSIDFSFWLLTLWVTGSLVMLMLAFRRQRQFENSVRKLATDTDGRLRGNGVAGPMLVGVWRPRIVLPLDFDDRYSELERAMILAHEEAHLVRQDALVNAVATTAQCLFWPNPLMYWAVNRLRFDQELACDASVLSRFPDGKRRYAHALLEAQLTNEAYSRLPVACHWQSAHPLKERIVMLKRPLPCAMRRTTGLASVITVIGLSSYSVWATQSEVSKEAPASDQSTGSYFFSSREFIPDGDGRYVATGDVVLKPPPGSPPPRITSDRFSAIDDGAKLFEGNVTIELETAVFKTERATVATDGTIRMDTVRISNLF